MECKRIIICKRNLYLNDFQDFSNKQRSKKILKLKPILFGTIQLKASVQQQLNKQFVNNHKESCQLTLWNVKSK